MLRQSDTDTHIARWLQTEFRPRPGRTLDITKPVQVYRCLTGGQGRYSIRQGRHVVGHANVLMLANVSFVASVAGHARRGRLGRKIVYAHAQGLLAGSGMGVAWDGWARPLPVVVAFNDDRGVFLNEQGRQVLTAGCCQLGLLVRAAYTHTANVAPAAPETPAVPEI